MTFPDEWPEIAWAKLSLPLRERAVDHLNANLLPGEREHFQKAYDENSAEDGKGEWIHDLGLGWHFSGGMNLRNLLRQEIKDDELPGLPEVYGKDHGGNWDDYYVQVLECAIDRRSLCPEGLWVNPNTGRTELWKNGRKIGEQG